jgi:peptide/nickel transport system substrate-binding protein
MTVSSTAPAASPIRRSRRPLVAVSLVAALAFAAGGSVAVANSSSPGNNAVAVPGSGDMSSGTPMSGATLTAAISGGTLTAAIPSDPTTLDWGINTDALTIDIAQNVYELLFAPDKNFVVRPMLASGYTVSADKRTYTISLRSGVKFQNGQTMTSADVVASMDRFFLVSGTGQEVKKSVTSVTASGADKVIVQLSKPEYSFIKDLAGFVQPCIIMPASIAKAAGAKTLSDAQIIGTGPYKLDNYVHGQYVELTKFAGYTPTTGNYGGLAGHKVAYIPTLIFKIVSDDTVRLDGIQTGQWQFAAGLQDDDYNTIQSNSSTTVAQAEAASLIEFLLVNNADGPFKSLKARQALNLAINKKAIAEATLGPPNLWSPLTGAFALPSNKPMYSTAGASVDNAYDPAKAKAMFAQAGVTSKTPITILSTQTYPGYYAMAQTIQSELKQIGIPVTIQTYDFPTMISKLSQQPASWDLSMTSFAGQPLDPGQLTFLSPTWPGGYTSTAMKAAMAQYEAATTATQARAAVNNIGIGGQVFLDASSPKLKDYGDFIGQGFWNAYLAK